MSILLLRLTGPMQSWGTQSRFTTRDTGLEPSKSGVVGLLGAALGFPRSAIEHRVGQTVIRLEELTSLEMGVRVDREGKLSRDFHTAGGGAVSGQPYGVAKADGKLGGTVVSTRYYLADADFLVALRGPRPLLETLQSHLEHPTWPLFLGRKAFTPSRPIWFRDGVTDNDDIRTVLARTPWQRPSRPSEMPDQLRLVLETSSRSTGEVRNDVPLSFASDGRQYTVRFVQTDWINEPNKLPRPTENLSSIQASLTPEEAPCS